MVILPKIYFAVNQYNELQSYYEFDYVFKVKVDFCLAHSFLFNYELNQDIRSFKQVAPNLLKDHVYLIELKSSWTLKCLYIAESFLLLFGLLNKAHIY